MTLHFDGNSYGFDNVECQIFSSYISNLKSQV